MNETTAGARHAWTVTARILVMTTWVVCAASPLCAGQTLTAVECGVDMQLIADSLFNPPLQGTVTYEWRNAENAIIGAEATLHLGPLRLPVGVHTLTLAADGGPSRRPTRTVIVAVADTEPPRVRLAPGIFDFGTRPVDFAAADGVEIIDVCDPQLSISLSPPGPYRPGETPVVLRVSDASGNVTEEGVTIRVSDVPTPGEDPTPISEPEPEPVEDPTPIPEPEPAPVVDQTPILEPEPAPVVDPTTTPEPEPAPPGVVTDTSARLRLLLPVTFTAAVGRAWLWIVALAVVILGALLLLAKRARPDEPSQAVAPPMVHARPKADGGVQRVDAREPVRIRYEMRLKPSLDAGEQRLEMSETPILGERRQHE